MRILRFAFIVCFANLPFLTFGQPKCETQFNSCVNNTGYRSVTLPPVSEGANRILNGIHTFAKIGTGLHDLLSVPAGSRLPLRQVLTDVLPDALLYLTPVNISFFEPFFDNASRIVDDLLYQFIAFNLSNAEQSIAGLVNTFDQSIDLVLDILDISFNDPMIEAIIMQIESLRSVPGFLDNITCLLLNVIEDPNIEAILSHSERIVTLINDVKNLASPLTQLFRNNTRFTDKFEQIRQQLSSSSALKLCVDSFLTNLICPQISGLSGSICNKTCVDTLNYCSAFFLQSLNDFSDVLDGLSLLTFEEVKSTEFEEFYTEIINISFEIVNTTVFQLADLNIGRLLNNTITTCQSESILSTILQNFNLTIPPEQVVPLLLSIIPGNPLENVTDFVYVFQNITETVLPYQNIRYAIQFITLPNGFLLNSLFSLAIQNTLTYFPPMGCFDPNIPQPMVSPLILPIRFPNLFNCWNGTAVAAFPSYSYQFATSPSDVLSNPAALRTCSFSIDSFMNARLITSIDLCDDFAYVIFGAPRTANFLASILSNEPYALKTCRSKIFQFLAEANVTIPTPSTTMTFFPTSTPFPTVCISNECTNSTPARPTITSSLQDGAEYILTTARTVATLGTSVSDFVDNIDDRDALEDLLESTLSPALTYLGGINDTDLRPFYDEMFRFVNELFYDVFLNFNTTNPSESVSTIVQLLERGLSLGENVTRAILGNDPNITMIFGIIDIVVSTPGFKENLTCILTELFTEPNIADILLELGSLKGLMQTFDLASQTILQLFKDSQIFQDKFDELTSNLSSSQALSLCVDSYLANLFCPSQPSYCQGNCVDTLNYCTAFLSQSLQDFSNVLDAVLLLSAGYVETPEFQQQFNQFREILFSITETSLDAFSRFDILGFINMTLRDCNTYPLIIDLISSFPIPGLPPLNSTEAIAGLIELGLGPLLSNFTIPTTPFVIDILNQTIQYSSLLNLTRGIYFIPDGFLLNGVLSLSVDYTMRSRPPQGCGYPIGMQGPLSYTLYNSFLSGCWNGESLLNFSMNFPNQFGGGSPFYDYSPYTISTNQAARRTCSYTYNGIEIYAISTSTNLCTIFSSIDPQSRMILQYAVDFGRLRYCRNFLGNLTSSPTPPFTNVTAIFTNISTPSSSPTPPFTNFTTPLIPTTPTGAQCETQFNSCVNNTGYRSVTLPPVSEGANRILNGIHTFAKIGTGLHDLLSVPAGSRLPLRQVLADVLPDALLYLTPVNISFFEPFFDNASRFVDDLLYQFIAFNLSNAEQSIAGLVNTFDQGIDLVLDILDISFNDPMIEAIIMQIESLRSVPGFLDNITCLLLNVIEDPNIEAILSHSERIVTLINDVKDLASPLTQLFRNNTRFTDKFEQIRQQLGSSSALKLCVDSFLTNLICPQISGLSGSICNKTCVDTLNYCSAFFLQSLNDFSDVLDGLSLLTFEEVKSTEFEEFYTEIINISFEIVNTTVFQLADLNIGRLLNNTITTCRSESILSTILQNFNLTIPPEQVVPLLLSIIPGNPLENVTDFVYVFQNITETVLPYQNIRYTIQFITLPNGFLLNSLFSLAIQNTLTYFPPMGCFDPNIPQPMLSPLIFPIRFPNLFNCWNGTAVAAFPSYSYQFATSPSDVLSNPAALRTCSFSIDSFMNARLITSIDLCDDFAYVIFGAPRTANFLASILSNDPYALKTCRSKIFQFLAEANVTIPTPSTTMTFFPTSTPFPTVCISNECTNSTPARPTITSSLQDGAEYILTTAKTVATLGTSVSDFVDNIDDRDALENLLESTLSPALTYLGGINDTDLRPFYDEMFRFVNELFYDVFLNFNTTNPSESVSTIVQLLERGLSLGENVTRAILGNDPNITMIFGIIDIVVSTPGFKENLTCILTELFTEPNIANILLELGSLKGLMQTFDLASQTILQLFRDSQIFLDKFDELTSNLPSSQALSLCVDSYLANLFCPSQPSYCQGNCVDTLNYCTAFLSQSLQDFSNVLDAVLLLSAGYVETPEFQQQFNQFREILFSITETSLDAFSRFDILGFINMTLRDCNTYPLIIDLISSFPIPGLPPLNSTEAIAGLIELGLGPLLSNFTIPTTPFVIDILNQTIQYSSLLNLTRGIYFIPDGFLLNGVLSLSVDYTMRSRPPQGCGYPIGMQGPLSYTLYNSFLSGCWNGESLLNFSMNFPNQFGGGSPFYDYSPYTISTNQAARRTCSYTYNGIEIYAISTSTNLCTIFSSIDPQSRMILQYAVGFGRLRYCRNFLGNLTSSPTPPFTNVTAIFTNISTPSSSPTPPFTNFTTPLIPTTPTGAQCETQFNSCVNNTGYRSVTLPPVSEGANRILNGIHTFAKIGTGLHDLLSVPAGSRLPLRQVLTDVLPDALLYLTPVNISFFEPFFDNASRFVDDLLHQFIAFNLSNAEQSIAGLVNTFDQGIDLVLDILDISFNDPMIEAIIMQIESLRSVPGFLDNITCLLLNVIEDPNIEAILSHSERIVTLINDVKDLASPLTQLFRNNTRFTDKFEQIRQQLGSSSALKLCVDSFLTNLICPQISGLSGSICNKTCVDTLNYCSAFFLQSLNDFSDVLDGLSLLTFEEVKSTEFEEFYTEIINISFEIVNTTVFQLADLNIGRLLNNTITTCQSESILSTILQNFNLTIPPEQVVPLLLSIIPENPLENVTNFVYVFQNITETVLPYQNIRYAIQFITLPNGFLLNSLFSLAIQNTLTYFPPMGCFDQNIPQSMLSPLIFPIRFPNLFNCWNGTAVAAFPSYSYQFATSPSDVLSNPAALRTCSFSIDSFTNARLITSIDLCDDFAYVIFGAPRTANFLASILSNDPYALKTCRSKIFQFLAEANVTIPTTSTTMTFFPTSTPFPTVCISNECTNSTPARPTITSSLQDGAEYILTTAKTVATLGTSVSDFVDNIDDRDALEDLLESTLSPALTYLGGINDTDLRPFYDEMFRFVNELFYDVFLNFNTTNPSESVSTIVQLLERGLSLGENVTRAILGNDPNITMIFGIIDIVVSTPGFKENLTCILTELFTEPNIADILLELGSLKGLMQTFDLASQTILQLFRDSQIFLDKFDELTSNLPSSQALSLCVDSYLANLFCPSQPSYCQGNCVDTLNYCTAFLSQSLQDFSNVLDAVLLLSAGYVETPEFQQQFNQFREILFSITETSLDAFSRFDILGFINMTLRDCNTYPLIIDLISSFPIPGLPPLNSTEAIAGLIELGLGPLLSNFTIPTTPFVIDILNQTIQYSSLLNLTRGIYFIPDGFLLNGVLSLSVDYTMRSRPPQGCGYPIGMQGPLSYTLYNSFLSGCWNGESLLNFSMNFPNQFGGGSPFYDYSPYTISTNQAARRTCSYTYNGIEIYAISTSTNLCTIFSSIDPQSRMILQYAVDFGRLRYCRNFLGNLTSSPTPPFTNVTAIFTNVSTPSSSPTTPSTPSSASSTPSSASSTPTSVPSTPSSEPIIAPNVNFQLSTYFASIGVNITVRCGGTGTNVQFLIVLLNETGPVFTTKESENNQQISFSFTSTIAAVYIFSCVGVNPAGNSSSRATIIVRSLSQNMDAIVSITPGSVVDVEEAMELLSVVGSLTGSDDIQNNATLVEGVANTLLVIVNSLDNTSISTDTAGAILGAFEEVENSPASDTTTTSPPGEEGEEEQEELAVPPVTIMVSRAIDIISLNLARQLVVGEPGLIVKTDGITIVSAAVERSVTSAEFTISDLSGAEINLPLFGFDFNERIEIGAAERTSPVRVQVANGQTVPLGSRPRLNSNLVNININIGQVKISVLPNAISLRVETSPIPSDGENVCTFLDEGLGRFIRGNVVTIPSTVADKTICETSHLTSFGVLVRAQSIQLSEAETLAISIVSYILLSISLIFLLASITLFLISAKSFFKVETNILYFNYAVSLTLATSVFIFGIQTARNSYIGCTVVGFLLHYTWLSVFSWSFAISLFMVYILYFGILNRKKIWWLMMIIGWGLPLPIVIPTIIVGLVRNGSSGAVGASQNGSSSALNASRNEYVNIGDHCFLSYTNGLIWAFLGPFVLLIIASSIGAVLSLIKMFLTMRDKKNKKGDFDLMKKLVVTVLVLLPVLSIPWIIGIANTFITSAVTVTVIEWVTILFTAPVGVLFFLLVVLRNAQVQDVVLRRKHVKGSTQTSGTVASKYTLPSKARDSQHPLTDSTADWSIPTTYLNPTYDTSTTVLLPTTESVASVEKEALRKLYETEKPPGEARYETLDVEKSIVMNKGGEGPKNPQNIYAALDSLTSNN